MSSPKMQYFTGSVAFVVRLVAVIAICALLYRAGRSAQGRNGAVETSENAYRAAYVKIAR